MPISPLPLYKIEKNSFEPVRFRTRHDNEFESQTPYYTTDKNNHASNDPSCDGRRRAAADALSAEYQCS